MSRPSDAAARTLPLPFVSPTERAVLQSAVREAGPTTRYMVLRHRGRDGDTWEQLYAFPDYVDGAARYDAERKALRQGELALVALVAGGGATLLALTALPRRGAGGGSYRRASWDSRGPK